ncbi:MAG: hypothetical protein IM653_00160 [Phenylobacterium sp.]|uniref:hypothetical protein n=1 Tax=Phenylobacterium sp. TaxID=1871053 RepID=UPI0025D60237|nr:hypothetical protein [Phenylobacterium sp.]MCA3709257.1 hypothetical protein [Phenylobacterium sp.]MCA3747430.1 hypothetical protein [Phenylobacterium sp.]MCA6227088.1 hypothetical protein [Phenylobacterium sp.]MCA6232708.1 hypothetical protein [Phenylobacterium sp.]MCA6233529.1 hypothetical protein [Phenylobacterium sp.]
MPHLHHTPHGVIAMTCLALFALTAQAAETTGSRPPENRPAKAAAVRPVPNTGEPKLICEQVQQMGSHFRRKVCATAEAWEARRRKDADQMQRMGDQGAGCGGVANPC